MCESTYIYKQYFVYISYVYFGYMYMYIASFPGLSVFFFFTCRKKTCVEKIGEPGDETTYNICTCTCMHDILVCVEFTCTM